ncbi:hypothetical protein TWF694_005055 [Orbilia ellipsospora]|uniref:G-patch domain-containing protein n=1 Tax=Orbilia ellipsospora TaxID=2528407 RepID=A0AAV9WUG3_9PEZI
MHAQGCRICPARTGVVLVSGHSRPAKRPTSLQRARHLGGLVFTSTLSTSLHQHPSPPRQESKLSIDEMTMSSSSRIKPSRPFLDPDDEDDAFSKLSSSRRQKQPPSSKLPPVDPKSISRPAPKPSTAPTSPPKPSHPLEEEEDDYMSMAIPSTSTTTESSLQRLKRRKLEASIRGHPLSKAELEAQERLKREIGLSTSILTNTSSKGFKMMKAMGFTTGSALGKTAPPGFESTQPSRTAEPIKPVVRESRIGIGHESELKRKFSEMVEKEGTKRREVSPEGYRNRLTLEAQQKRHEAQLFAAQSICEKLVAEDPPAGYGEQNNTENKDEGAQEGREKEKEKSTNAAADYFTASPTFTQIKQINLIYRGLLYRRALNDVKKKLQKRDNDSISSLKYSGVTQNLPTYSNAEYTVDDKLALSMNEDEIDLDEKEWEDTELEEFENREVKDRLDEIVRYLRSQWRYCFWCKFRYKTDEDMEKECPGVREEDHD